MKLNKSKISIVFALVLCMVISIAMPIMSSADESDLYANKRELDVENVVNPVQGMIDYIGDTGKEITMSLRNKFNSFFFCKSFYFVYIYQK